MGASYFVVLIFVFVFLSIAQGNEEGIVPEVFLVVKGGQKTNTGVYFTGDKVSNHEHFEQDAPEHLLSVVKPGETLTEGTTFGSSFIFRSSDMQNRMRIDVNRNLDPVGSKSRPFQISFYNLAHGDRVGDYPIELKHGQSGYLWLEGSHYVSHSTTSGHQFTLRDINHYELFAVSLYSLGKSEL